MSASESPSAVVAPGIAPGGALRAPGARHRRGSLRVNIGWTLAGNAVYAGCHWAVVVVIAKLGSPEALGQFALGTAVSGPLLLLAAMHLRGAQATDAARSFAFSDYLGVRIAAMAVGLVLVGAVVGVSAYGRADAAVVLAVALTRAVEGVGDIHHGLMQQRERMRPVAVSLASRSALALAAMGAVLGAGGTLLGGVLAQAVVSLAVVLVWDVRAAAALLRDGGERRRPRFDAGRMRRLVAVAFPLGLVMMAVSLRTNAPRYFVEHHAGTRELGVFAALSSLVAAGTMVVSAAGQAASPRLARYHHERTLAAFRRLLGRLLALAMGLGLVGVAAAATVGGPLLRALFGAEYAARADALVWLMAAGGVAYASSFVGYALTAARLLTVQLPLFGGAAVACVGLSAWLVPAHGLAGAAWAWGASLILELVVAAAVLSRGVRRRAAGG